MKLLNAEKCRGKKKKKDASSPAQFLFDSVRAVDVLCVHRHTEHTRTPEYADAMYNFRFFFFFFFLVVKLRICAHTAPIVSD